MNRDKKSNLSDIIDKVAGTEWRTSEQAAVEILKDLKMLNTILEKRIKQKLEQLKNDPQDK